MRSTTVYSIHKVISGRHAKLKKVNHVNFKLCVPSSCHKREFLERQSVLLAFFTFKFPDRKSSLKNSQVNADCVQFDIVQQRALYSLE